MASAGNWVDVGDDQFVNLDLVLRADFDRRGDGTRTVTVIYAFVKPDMPSAPFPSTFPLYQEEWAGQQADALHAAISGIIT